MLQSICPWLNTKFLAADSVFCPKMMKTVLNWSSGKDAAFAYMQLASAGKHQVTRLLTTLSQQHDRVLMHGVRETLLDMQAERMGLPLTKMKLPASPTDQIYADLMHNAFANFKQQGIEAAAFGDIFLQDLREYREQQLAKVGLSGVFPLWKMDTRLLASTIAEQGIEAIIICVDDRHLGNEFLGRKIDQSLLNDLPAQVDPCGENGEYHSFVYNAPFFTAPIHLNIGETVHRTYTAPQGAAERECGFYFLDIFAEGHT